MAQTPKSRKVVQRPVAQPAPTVAEVPEPSADDMPIRRTQILPPVGQIHGTRVLELYQGDYRLAVWQDRNMNALVTYYQDEIISVLRGHRRQVLSTYGMHVASIVRLAVNHSDNAAAGYVHAALFFDANLSGFAKKEIQALELHYSHPTESNDHEGYIFIAGPGMVFDEGIPVDAPEVFHRAMPYLRHFHECYTQPTAHSLVGSLLQSVNQPADKETHSGQPLRW